MLLIGVLREQLWKKTVVAEAFPLRILLGGKEFSEVEKDESTVLSIGEDKLFQSYSVVLL